MKLRIISFKSTKYISAKMLDIDSPSGTPLSVLFHSGAAPVRAYCFSRDCIF